MVLEEIGAAVRELSERLDRSVVGVGQRWTRGSGVVVAEGKVLTNAHNLRGREVTVTFGDGRKAEATVAGVDPDGDLAVLDVDTAGAVAIEWPDGDTPAIGEPVFGVANPGGSGLRVTFGLVSGTQRSFRGPRGRRITGSVEHTSPLLPGSSGGPIVDARGRFLGINTNRLGEGFYLAIPADGALRERVSTLSRGESRSRPRLGVGIAPPHVARGLRRAVGLPEADGLLVREVEDGGPAATAGIAEGDLLTESGGRKLTGVDDLHDAIDAAGEAGELELKVLRASEERTVTVRLAAERG